MKEYAFKLAKIQFLDLEYLDVWDVKEYSITLAGAFKSSE